MTIWMWCTLNYLKVYILRFFADRIRRRHSKSTIPAATLTLRDATPPATRGMRTRKSQCFATCSCRPRPSAPTTMAVGAVQVGYTDHGDVGEGSGGAASYGFGESRGATLGDHDGCGSGGVRGADY